MPSFSSSSSSFVNGFFICLTALEKHNSVLMHTNSVFSHCLSHDPAKTLQLYVLCEEIKKKRKKNKERKTGLLFQDKTCRTI